MKLNKKRILVVGIAAAVVIAAAVIGAILRPPAVDVVIDPGHGGNDVGAQYEGRNEKDDNLDLALLVTDNLKDMGVKVKLTRDDDTFISLEKRCKIANRRRAKLFVALHRNSADSGKGVEIWISSDAPQKDTALAENILSELDEVGISKNRGVKAGYAQGDGNYYVNSHTNMASCLAEIGFITSEEDNKLLDDNLNAYAEAIATAIKNTL